MLSKIESRLSSFKPVVNEFQVRRASVLIPLLEREGEARLMLTRRSDQLRSHSGQVSFPGGKEDERDRSSLDTALRETREEIGLESRDVKIIGCLDQIISLHFYLVTPFVGLIPEDFIPNPNSLETESVFEVPLNFFMKSEHHWSEELNHRKFPVISHHFFFKQYDIWGMTAKLILRLLEVGLEHQPEYQVHHLAAPPWMELAQHFDGTEESLSFHTHSPNWNRGI